MTLIYDEMPLKFEAIESGTGHLNRMQTDQTDRAKVTNETPDLPIVIIGHHHKSYKS